MPRYPWEDEDPLAERDWRELHLDDEPPRVAVALPLHQDADRTEDTWNAFDDATRRAGGTPESW